LKKRCYLLKIFDISLPISPDLPVWPGDPPIVLERIRAKSEGSASNDSRIACSVHSGTHVDAPLHFIDQGASVEQLPLDILVGPAAVVEVPDTDIITPNILERLTLSEQTKRLLIKTRNAALWRDARQAFNPDFVALDSHAARWVVDRGIGLIGVDYLSVQLFKDKDPTTHRVLLDAGVVIVEGLDLHAVKPGTYQLICLPLKLVGSDGAPARTILIEE
jgi:arylformamidase